MKENCCVLDIPYCLICKYSIISKGDFSEDYEYWECSLGCLDE